jgi:branched-chain amino acid transport system substrate-binding protein
MRGTKRWGLAGALALVAAVAVAAVGVTTASGAKSAKPPIIIGAAVDLSGNMSPFDSPALSAAKIEIGNIDKAGGVLGGRKLVLKQCNTQLKPDVGKACGADLVSQGAVAVLTTCDVEYGAPATQEVINAGRLAVASCVGTDQQGPKRFGKAGKLAFSLGNVAQDEGAAMAEYAYMKKGWRTAIIVKDNLLIYFQNVADAFANRFQELGGKIVQREGFSSFDKTITNVVSRVNPTKADVICFVTGFGDLPTFVSGLRSLGNNTPIFNSWAGDGSYWWTLNPKVTNYYYVTYASIFGHDPSKPINNLLAQIKAATGQRPLTGSYITGAAAIDAIVAAINQTKSTNGLKLANAFEHFRKLPTISGLVSFTPQLHSVFGRAYRVIVVNNNRPKFLGLWVTKKLAKL